MGLADTITKLRQLATGSHPLTTVDTILNLIATQVDTNTDDLTTLSTLVFDDDPTANTVVLRDASGRAKGANAAGASDLVALGQLASLLQANQGYFKIPTPNGIVMVQWGVESVTINTDGTKAITFTPNFSAIYGCFPAVRVASGQTPAVSLSVLSLALTGCTVVYEHRGDAGDANGFYWIAVGKVAS